MSDKDLGASRKNGINRTLFKDTLSRALLADDAKKLRAMCDQLLEMSLDKSLSAGERLAAMKLIIERVDGRPKEQVDDSGEDKPTVGMFKIVKVE